MKKLFTMVGVLAILALTPQTQAQLKGSGDDGQVQLPAIQAARNAARTAFYASYDAWIASRAESSRSVYFYGSAELQFEALINSYLAWSLLESTQSLSIQQWLNLRSLAADAEDAAYDAAWYALVGGFDVGNPQHEAYLLAINSWNKIELLVRKAGLIMPDM